jgi:FMN hydrolase / 5-amino-6-(5-phospho-D-ribitylamino)uracil phosphatase
VELDLDFLAHRLVEREVQVTPGALGAAAGAAWRHYDDLVDRGCDHAHAWRELIGTLLAGAGVAGAADHAAWLYRENARANLWRRPITGMVDLARELAARGLRVGVLSNSEGRLAELLAEVGIADAFAVIVDSGRVGLEKPDPRIFAHALAALGGDTGIHIGDSWDADIAGARACGWRALWYGRRVSAVEDPAVAIARDPAEARAALASWLAL